MLSHKVLVRQDLNLVANYYEDSADDYYAKEGESSGWHGRGATVLGLTGAVDRAQFRGLLSGKISASHVSTRSFTRKDSRDRIGIDLTFSAPKSVSLQALVGGDARLITAHEEAVAEVLTFIETFAQGRQKIKGKSRVETTGNLTIATFRHETSRALDPQLHTHAVIMNLTQRSDGEWRALHNEQIIKRGLTFGAEYRALLAQKVQQLGYTLRLERDGLFELDHLSRDQLLAFSQRREQIDADLAQQGLTRETASTGQKQTSTLKTRRRKELRDRAATFNMWQRQAQDLGLDFDGYRAQTDSRTEKSTDVMRVLRHVTTAQAVKRALRYSVSHLTERQAVVGETQLLKTALEHAMGSATLTDIQAGLKTYVQEGKLIPGDLRYKAANQRDETQAQSKEAWMKELTDRGMTEKAAQASVTAALQRGRLVAVERQYTTPIALEEERLLLKRERDGRNQRTALLSASQALTHLKPFTLNPGQEAAALLIITTRHQMVGIGGYAGTGKSHMLQAAKQVIEQHGHHVLALAPYGTQVEALRKLNVDAKTVASFLKSQPDTFNEQTVLVIDEASVLPTRQMKKLTTLADRVGARIVLMGDVAQTKAIEAGRPFDALQNAGMETVHLTEIQRQKNIALKTAVIEAAHGRVEASLSGVSEIVEIKDAYARYVEMTQHYLALSTAQRQKTIIISGTNKARCLLNTLIRQGLEEEQNKAGRVMPTRSIEILGRRDATAAERRLARTYHLGDKIQPERGYANGLRWGELYTIVATGPKNTLTVESAQGQQICFNPARCRHLSVYQPEKIDIRVGESLRITRNDNNREIRNGDRFTVSTLDKRRLTLTDGERTITLPLDKPLHLNYAYATTVHSSQGATQDLTLFDIDTKSRTTAQDTYYVGLSRARHRVILFTDDKDRLPDALAQQTVKHAALDIVRSSKRVKKSLCGSIKESTLIKKIDPERER